MKLIYLIAIILVVCSCNKRNSKKWFVEKSEISIGCLEQVNTSYNTYFEEPLIYNPNCEGYVFEETQLVNRIFNGPIRQSIVIKLPDDTIDFYYQNIEILSNTNFYIYNSNDFSYYRIANGWIKGNYEKGSWVIDFDLFYGGKKNDKYHIKKGANY
jgi:hypothetical protein